jgi:hypothetical protein
VSDTSRKVYRCDEEQRLLRGGRLFPFFLTSQISFHSPSIVLFFFSPSYAGFLKPSLCAPLIELELENGKMLNETIVSLWPASDPFVTSTEVNFIFTFYSGVVNMPVLQLLCQQVSWHYEDLDPHCDKERRDKSSDK